MGNALACRTAESREQPWPGAARSTVATGRTRKHTRARHARNRAFNSAKANMCSAIWPSLSSSVGVQRRCGLPGGASMSRHACKKRQQLQLTMPPGRQRAKAPRFLAILMSWTCHNPILIRLAGRPPNVGLVITKTAADGRNVITPHRLAVGRRRPYVCKRRGRSTRTGRRAARSLTWARGCSAQRLT